MSNVMKTKILLAVLLVFTSLSSFSQIIDDTFILSPKVNLATVIDIKDVKFHNGNKLQVWEYYSGSSNQHFKIKRIDSGVVQFISNYDTDKAFDVPDGKMTNGNTVQIWKVYPNPIQYWNLEHVSGVYYVIRCNLDPSYVLTVDGNGGNGSKVYISKYTGEDNQIWAIIGLGGKVYKVYKQGYDKSRK